MKPRILLFASLREAAGDGELSLDIPEGSTIDELWQRIAADIDSLPEKVLCAVNQQYVERSHVITADDHEIAFFPPVTGG